MGAEGLLMNILGAGKKRNNRRKQREKEVNPLLNQWRAEIKEAKEKGLTPYLNSTVPVVVA